MNVIQKQFPAVTKPVSRRDWTIDATKGIAIFGVLAAHSGHASLGSNFLPQIQLALGWCVTAFFSIAGFLEAEAPRKKSWRDSVRSRARRLLLPFGIMYLANNIALMILCRIPGVIHAPGLLKENLAEALFRSHSPQLYFLPLLWFISLVLWAPVRSNPARAAVIAALGSALWSLLVPATNAGYGFHLENMPTYVAAFIIGYAARSGKDRIALLFCLGAGVIEFTLYGSYHALHPVMALVIIKVLGRLPKPLPVLPLIGRWSFAIFLWHAPLLMPLVRRLWETTGWPQECYLWGVWFCTIAICLLWAKLLYTTKRLRFLAA